MTFHPALSPSPLEHAFGFVVSSPTENGGFLGLNGNGSFSENDDNNDSDSDDQNDTSNDLPPFMISPPESSLLRSAEENPLEYTLAEPDDAVSYLRTLFKMLDQVTTNSSGSATTGGSTYYSRNSFSSPTTNNNSPSQNRVSLEDEKVLTTLDTPPLSKDEAFDWYYFSSKNRKRRKLVVAHYCITKIYEIFGEILDGNFTMSLSELFYGESSSTTNSNHHQNQTIYVPFEEWRQLLKILYSRSSDEFTKRGSSLILAFLLNTGCKLKEGQKKQSKPAPPQDEDLLDLFGEHKTVNNPTPVVSPSSNNQNNNNALDSGVIEETLQSFVSWLTARLQSSGRYSSLGVVTPTLGVLLSTNEKARFEFVQAGGIGYVSRHLREKRRQRTVYSLRQHQRRSTSSAPVAKNIRNCIDSLQQPQTLPIPTQKPSPTRQRRRSNNPRNSSSLSSSMRSHGSNQSSSSELIPGLSSELGQMMQSMPSTEDIEEGFDQMFDSARATASKAAALAQQAAPIALQALTTSMSSAETTASPRSSTTVTASSSVQQFYDLVFCLWCLSLDCAASSGDNEQKLVHHFTRDGAIPALAHLLKKVPREKVLRVTLACLRSLSDIEDDKGEKPFVRDMIGCGVLKSLETVKQRRWNDSDMEVDLDYLLTTLSECTEELTQWSAYEAQIATRILRWDEMLHTHDFFRANARHMEGPKGDFAPLRLLVEILYSNTSSGKLRASGRADQISYVGLNEVGGWDEEDLRDDEVCETLAVCLFDIGEFARNYPNGRAVLGSSSGGIKGAKTLIMTYVHHPRDDVREQALICASKLLIRNWRAIQQQEQ